MRVLLFFATEEAGSVGVVSRCGSSSKLWLFAFASELSASTNKVNSQIKFFLSVCVQTLLCLVCTQDLNQDSPIQTYV